MSLKFILLRILYIHQLHSGIIVVSCQVLLTITVLESSCNDSKYSGSSAWGGHLYVEVSVTEIKIESGHF